MPVGSPSNLLYRYQGQALAALPASAAETALISTPVIQASAPSGLGQVSTQPQPVKISGVINITAGAGTTGITIRVRQGVGTGGAVVGAAMPDTLAAGNSESLPFSVEDITGVSESAAGTAYTVTVVQTGATAAGTINTFDLEVSA